MILNNYDRFSIVFLASTLLLTSLGGVDSAKDDIGVFFCDTLVQNFLPEALDDLGRLVLELVDDADDAAVLVHVEALHGAADPVPRNLHVLRRASRIKIRC